MTHTDPQPACWHCGSDRTDLAKGDPCPHCGRLPKPPISDPATNPATDPTSHRPAIPACVHCDYDLTGLAPRTPCPECGTIIPDPDAHAADTLDEFVFCTGCGYHLAGLSRKIACPECGQPTANSAIPQSLYRSKHAYLKDLHVGFRDLALAHAFVLFAFVFVILGPRFLMPLLGGTGLFITPFLPSIAILLGVIIFCVVFIFSWSRVTRRDPVLGVNTLSEQSRKTTRITAIIYFLLYIPGLFCVPYSFVAISGVAASVIVPLLYFGAGATHLFASVTYAERLIQRTGRKAATRKIAKCKTALQFLVLIFGVCVFLTFMILANANSAMGPVILGILSLTLFGAILAVYTWLLWITRSEIKLVEHRTTSVHTNLAES